MDLIQGRTGPKRWRPWGSPRPVLRLVREPDPARAGREGEDLFILAMLAAFGVIAVIFVSFIGVWIGG